MVSRTFLIALLFVTSLNLANLAGQDGGCTRRAIPVGVTDRQWNLVQGLSAVNFRGKLRGHEVEIVSASIDMSPRRIVLLLDASGSMMGEWWEAAKSLSADLIRSAPPRASIAQMAFSETVLDTAGFEQDPFALLKRLADMVKVCEQPRKTRRTALFDAIGSARGMLGGLEFGDVIFAVTDGGDNCSRTKPKRVEQDLLGAGIRLFSALPIGQSTGTPMLVPEYMISVGRLHAMVEATGGNMLALPYAAASEPYRYIKAKTRAEAVVLALHTLYEQIARPYRLELRLPERVDKPTSWKLEVIAANGKPSSDVEVHFPQQLMPCTQADE
jgi:hypothetical protein